MKTNNRQMNEDKHQCDIFISYRRDGGDMAAMYFFQALKDRGYNVFYDVEVLRSGKFNEALLSSIRSCKDFILILSPHALDRCQDKNDWVRMEIAEALRLKKNIIPILMKGFVFPETLPDDIDDIRFQNGLSSTTEYFQESINRLCERYLESQPKGKSGDKGKTVLIAIIAVLVVMLIGITAFFLTRKPDIPKTVEMPPMPEQMTVQENGGQDRGVSMTPEITQETRSEMAQPDGEGAMAGPVAEQALTPVPEVNQQVVPDLSAAGNGISSEQTDGGTETAQGPGEQPGPETAAPEAGEQQGPETAVPEAGDAAGAEQSVIIRNTSYPVLMTDDLLQDYNVNGETYSENPVLGRQDLLRKQISSVTFLPSLEAAGENAWDVSEMSDGRVLAWTVPNGDLFDLYIAGDGGVKIRKTEETSLELFVGYSNAVSISFNGCVDFSEAISMKSLFDSCYSLKSIDLTGLDTSHVLNMGWLFNDCKSLESIDLSQFDTAHVQTMEHMFNGCEALERLDLTSFNTAYVQSMLEMFMNCKMLAELDISGFDTSHVLTMEGMFTGCERLQHLDLHNFETDHVTDMTAMFADCRELRSLDISSFDTGLVTSTRYMFNNCQSLTELDVSHFNMEKVRTTEAMFSDCVFLSDLKLGQMNTASDENMSWMFYNCASLTELNLSTMHTERAVTMQAMFQQCTNMRTLDVSGFDTSRVKNMHDMFQNCKYIESLDLHTFDMSSVEDIGCIFCDCSYLTDLNLSGWNTSQVRDMRQLFENCEMMEQMDLTGLNTASVVDMSYMFHGCKYLVEVLLTDWNLVSVEDMRYMFADCTSLESIGRNPKEFIRGLTEGMFDNCPILQ